MRRSRGIPSSDRHWHIRLSASRIFVEATNYRSVSGPPTICKDGFRARRHGFGRLADLHAQSSALAARYFIRPLFRPTSRLIVEGARSSCAAIFRSDRPAANPRDISSRSCTDRDRRDRLLTGGAMPPFKRSTPKIDPAPRPRLRPISLSDRPAFHCAHSSCFCCDDKPGRPICSRRREHFSDSMQSALMLRSTTLESISIRPSSRKRVRPSQRERA